MVVYLNKIVTLLSLTGLDEWKGNHDVKRASAWFVLILSVMAPIQFLTTGLIEEENLLRKMKCLLVGIATFNLATKLIYLHWKSKELHWVIDELRTLTELQARQKINRSILDKAEKSVTLITNSFLYCFAICVTAAGVIGLTVTILSVGFYGGSEYLLPLELWLPFRVNTNTRYVVAYIYQVIACVIGVIAFTTCYATFCAIVIHVTAQIEILKGTLGKIKWEGGQSRDEPEVTVIIREAVDHHVLIIRMVQKLNAIYGEVVFLELLLSSLQICLLVIQFLTRPVTDLEMLFFWPFMICTATMPYSICWGGEMLKNQSFSLRDAIYETPWYELSPKIRKDIHLFQKQASRTLTLNARTIFFMDMETFGKMIQAAYSYYTVLRSFI